MDRQVSLIVACVQGEPGAPLVNADLLWHRAYHIAALVDGDEEGTAIQRLVDAALLTLHPPCHGSVREARFHGWTARGYSSFARSLLEWIRTQQDQPMTGDSRSVRFTLQDYQRLLLFRIFVSNGPAASLRL